MVKKKKGRTKRVGLISEREQELIEITDNKKKLIKEIQRLEAKETNTNIEKKHIKEIAKKLEFSSKRFSTFELDLFNRLEAARIDLQFILKSNSLQRFRTRYRKFFRKPFVDGDYNNYPLTGFFTDLEKLEFKKYDGTEPIPNYSQWKVHETNGTIRKFWLSINENPKPTVRDSTEPEFAIVGIKGTWRRKSDTKDIEYVTINVREILLKSLDLEKRWQEIIASKKLPQIIPRDKDDAIDILNIQKKTKKFEIKLKNLE